jgi:hypothetical protein
MSTAVPQVDEAAVTPPEARRDPRVRRKMSGPALRTFFNVAERWGLGTEQQRALLGWPAKSTLHNWKGGTPTTLPYDTLLRISLVLGIYKALHVLYPDDRFADSWVKMPNSNPMFGGGPAVDLMTGGDIDGLYRVRRLLDARRGGWS